MLLLFKPCLKHWHVKKWGSDVTEIVPPSHLFLAESSSMFWTSCCTTLSRSWSITFSDRTSSSRVLPPSTQNRSDLSPNTVQTLTEVPSSEGSLRILQILTSVCLKPDFLRRQINVINIYKKFSIKKKKQTFIYQHEDKLTYDLSFLIKISNLAEVFVSALNIGQKQTETLNLSFLCIWGEQITGVMMSFTVKSDRMMSLCDVMQWPVG